MAAFASAAMAAAASPVIAASPGGDRATSSRIRGPFELQGHRGARGLAPENTLAGVDAALAAGVDTLELDLGVTRDGVVVLSHDRRLNPDITRDGSGAWLAQPGRAIRALDLADLQRYDVGRIRPGSALARRFPEQVPADGSRMPSLAQVFRHVAARGAAHVGFNLEIKTSPLAPGETLAPDEFARAVLDEVLRHRMGERTTIQSFDWRSLQAMQAMQANAPGSVPGIATVYLSAQRPEFDTIRLRSPDGSPWTAGWVAFDHRSVPSMVKAAGGAAWSPAFADLNVQAVSQAQALGLRVVPWTANDPDVMRRLLDWGVDGIITDRPDLLRQVMAERGMRLPPRLP